jgi:hypothetical protein
VGGGGWNPVWVSRNGEYKIALLGATVLFFPTEEKWNYEKKKQLFRTTVLFFVMGERIWNGPCRQVVGSEKSTLFEGTRSITSGGSNHLGHGENLLPFLQRVNMLLPQSA